MTCKEIREKELEELKEGTLPGVYFVTITHFDGRPVAQFAYDEKHVCDKMYSEFCQAYKYKARVKRSVTFEY